MHGLGNNGPQISMTVKKAVVLDVEGRTTMSGWKGGEAIFNPIRYDHRA
jgi:hypothetical protein